MEGNNKVGAYPRSDEQNNFGELCMKFFDPQATRDPNDLLRIFNGVRMIAKANADKEYLAAEEAYAQTEMNTNNQTALVWEAYAMSVRLGWWKWKETPHVREGYELAQ